jgi:SulP family sulfate permease
MIARLVPAADWLLRYRGENLRGDLVAGLTVGVMLVPQAMAYAMLAGLPPVVGLYAATLPVLAYALLGSSRQLAVGPVAMISLLVMTGCSELAEPGTEEYIGLALLLAFIVGVAQLALGVVKMGFVVNFLSHAVISGFTSAAAIVICLSQLKHLLGIDVERAHSAFGIAREVVTHLAETHPATLIIGGLGVAVLALARKHAPRLPGPLIVVVAGTLAVYALELGDVGVRAVGEVPSGLPTPALPTLDLGMIGKLGPTALVIIFVGYMESVAVAQLIAAREKQKIDPDIEFRALGVANIVAGVFSGYPVTGGFSRTAVNYQSGAKTGLAGIVTTLVVGLTLLFLTPLFVHLPNAVLASIIIVAVVGLIDVKTAHEYFRGKPCDGWTLALTFASTLALGIERGILIGAAFSLLVFIWRSAHPHIAELGYLPDRDIYRNISRFPEAVVDPRAVVLRVDAALYFANMGFVENRIRESLADRPDVGWVVLDLNGVNDIDAVAIHALGELMKAYRERGICFALVAMKGPVRDLVERAGWDADSSDPVRFASLEQAMDELGLRGRRT